jgi:cyclophilin family peptidyl-prolyl cis-trans isomerase
MEALRQQQLRKKRQRRFALTGAAAAVVVAVIAVVAFLVTGTSTPKKTAGKTTTSASTPSSSSSSTAVTTTLPAVSVPLLNAPKTVGCPNMDGSSPHYTHFSVAPPMCIDTSKAYTAKLATTLGTITVKLSTAAADQKTVNNFVFLSEYHFYDGTWFHRIVTGFADQGGDPQGTGQGGPGYSFNGGAPKSASVYKAGSLDMANSGSSSSDGSQFFFVVGSGGKQLQPLYSVVGQVSSGLKVVNAINKEGSPGEAGTPKKAVIIKSVTITAS